MERRCNATNILLFATSHCLNCVMNCSIDSMTKSRRHCRLYETDEKISISKCCLTSRHFFSQRGISIHSLCERISFKLKPYKGWQVCGVRYHVLRRSHC